MKPVKRIREQLDKSALVAEIKKKIRTEQGYSSGDAECGYRDCARDILSLIDTLEVKEVQEQKEELTDKERIREEIERLHEEYRGKKGDADVRRALRTVLFFIDCM